MRRKHDKLCWVTSWDENTWFFHQNHVTQFLTWYVNLGKLLKPTTCEAGSVQSVIRLVCENVHRRESKQSVVLLFKCITTKTLEERMIQCVSKVYLAFLPR